MLVVTDYAKMPPTQEIYMHALARQTLKQHWNDAWFETWDLFWLGGKGKGKNGRGGMGFGKGTGDDGRAEYEEQLKTERANRNQRWEDRVKTWEQGSLGEKGFGKGKKKGGKGKYRDFVYIPSTIPGNKNQTYPFDVEWFEMTTLEHQREPVFEALMQQNPHQLEAITKPADSPEAPNEAVKRNIKGLEKKEGKRGAKRGNIEETMEVEGSSSSGGTFGAPMEGVTKAGEEGTKEMEDQRQAKLATELNRLRRFSKFEQDPRKGRSQKKKRSTCHSRDKKTHSSRTWRPRIGLSAAYQRSSEHRTLQFPTPAPGTSASSISKRQRQRLGSKGLVARPLGK